MYPKSILNFCEKAIDGDMETAWATNNEDVGAWIEIVFPGKYDISKFSFTNRRCCNAGDYTQLSAVFSPSGVTKVIDLNPDTTITEFTGTPKIIATSVRITMTGIDRRDQNGADDISFWGVEVGNLSCSLIFFGVK